MTDELKKINEKIRLVKKQDLILDRITTVQHQLSNKIDELLELSEKYSDITYELKELEVTEKP